MIRTQFRPYWRRTIAILGSQIHARTPAVPLADDRTP
jgi:hypothetical protein